MEVGKRITFYRQQQGLTTNKLANLSGLSQSYLRDIELGKKNPTVESLSYICDALNISLSDFFDDSVQEKISEDPLIKTILKLNKNQRNALLTFLNTLEWNRAMANSFLSTIALFFYIILQSNLHLQMVLKMQHIHFQPHYLFWKELMYL